MSVRENNMTTEKERSNNKTERDERPLVSLLDTPPNSPQYGRDIHKKDTVNNQLKRKNTTRRSGRNKKKMDRGNTYRTMT